MSIKGFIYKLIMNTAGQNSKGIDIAQTYGLNSAEMMDYVYRRIPAPKGDGFWGTWADSIFLNFPTWESLRKRKNNIQNILYYILKEQFIRKPDKQVKILDLASGYSQYIFPVLDKLEEKSANIYVEMRDKNTACEQYINFENKKGYNIKFLPADITDESNYDFNNQFDIILLTGFYDSMDMADVKTIEKTMRFVTQIMKEKALFIFSYQSSHVDSGLVNELFRDTNGALLSMGERSQVDIEYIMKKFELQNLGQISDDEGRYTIVISARADVDVDFIKQILAGKKD